MLSGLAFHMLRTRGNFVGYELAIFEHSVYRASAEEGILVTLNVIKRVVTADNRNEAFCGLEMFYPHYEEGVAKDGDQELNG